MVFCWVINWCMRVEDKLVMVGCVEVCIAVGPACTLTGDGATSLSDTAELFRWSSAGG